MTSFKIIHEFGQPLTITWRYQVSRTLIVPHSDYLPRPPRWSRAEIQTMMIARAVIGQRYPARVPPIGYGVTNGIALYPFEITTVQQIFPYLPLVYNAL